MPGAQWSQTKRQAWESSVCRRLGTPGTTLRDPCLCTQLAEALCWGCLSPHPGRGSGWVGASRAPSLPRPAVTGGELRQGAGRRQGTQLPGLPPVPRALQLSAGRAAKAARRGTAARGWPWSCSRGGMDALRSPQRCRDVLFSLVKEPVGGLAGSHVGHVSPTQGATGVGGYRAPTGIISVGFPSSALKQSPAVRPLAVRVLPNPMSPCVTSSPRRWPPPPDRPVGPCLPPLASPRPSVVAGGAARGTGQGASVAPQHPLCTPERLAELGEI